jgi:pyruvate/2-oxoglutarate dehydrogenase complex dihydrolipoamide dehydrogenase (E3) component
MIRADIAVIGAGSGGLSVAAGAAQLGLRCVLFEKSEMGGDCLNHGCVPSKALIAAAQRAHMLRSGARLGVGSSGAAVDFSAVMAHVRSTISAIAPMDSQERFEKLGVEVIREAARFSSRRTLESPSVSVSARKIVIATGSRAFVPDIPGLSQTAYLTNETIFSLQRLPERLIILGAGPIGMELGQAFSRLGSRVVIIDKGRGLEKEDADIASVVTRQLQSEGVEIITGAHVAEIRPGPEVTVDTDGGRRLISGDQLLIALGRRPAVDELNLPAAGIAFGPEGIRVDRQLRTSNRHVLAIGDVAGLGQFTHLAGAHASLAVRRAIFGLGVDHRRLHVPRTTYTDPEIAAIGLTLDSARRRYGDNLRVIELPFSANDRAESEADTRGMARLVALRSGRVIGIQIVGRGAGEQALVWSLMLSAGLPLSRLTSAIAPYPTRSEISKRLAGLFYADALFSPRTRRLVSVLKHFA